MTFDYRMRRERLAAAMAGHEVDGIVLSVGPDLPYFTGYEAMESERWTALVMTGDFTRLLVPELEAPRVGAVDLEVVAWDETTDPISIAGGWLSKCHRIAAGDHMWSSFLMRLIDGLPGRRWRPASELTSSMRVRKDPTEVEMLGLAARAVDRVMARIPAEVRFGGRSEIEIARDLRDLTVEEGHDDAQFCIVASGPHGASPHHHPGQRLVEMGDLVVCDFGGRWQGYFSDSTRTFVVGEPSQRQTEVHEVVEAANLAGREAVRPGAACEDVDRAARQVTADAGYAEWFIHRTGHGIGLEVHEHPYLVEGNTSTLEAGMTFSVEPGIYLPGEFGVRIEDIVVCTTDSVESLNNSDRGLVSVS